MSTTGRIPKTAKDIYRGYIPPDLPQNRPRERFKRWWKVEGKPRVTIYPKKQIEGYSETPEYPPLNDGTRRGVKNQIRYDWYETIKAKPTVEAKLLEINKHQTHYIAHVNNWLPMYNPVPMVKFLTRTHLISNLPERYNISEDEDSTRHKELVEHVRQLVLDQIALDKYESLKRYPQFITKSCRNSIGTAHVSNQLIQNLVSSLKKSLAIKLNDQLMDYQYDLSPALRSWWYHSGFGPPNRNIYYRARMKQGKINQLIQMNGYSSLNIRHDSFIEPIIDMKDELVKEKSLIEDYESNLKFAGAQFIFKRLVALPGFWYNDDKSHFLDCPHTCFLSTDCLKKREMIPRNLSSKMDDVEDCLNGQAILTAFGWLNSLSMYHGYTPFHKIDYPFTCQVVTTDGQNWLFNVYQLNDQVFHRDRDHVKSNNICWSSGLMKLFEEYDNGEFKGVNDDVIKMLIFFFAQKTSPEYTSRLNLRPLLGEDTRTEEEKAHEEERLRETFVGRTNRIKSALWRVPVWEHIFFRSKAGRHRITHMKPKWKPPKPPISKNFG